MACTATQALTQISHTTFQTGMQAVTENTALYHHMILTRYSTLLLAPSDTQSVLTAHLTIHSDSLT